MLRNWLFIAALVLFGGTSGMAAPPQPAASENAAPKIDKPKFEAYVRYAEGFPAAVQVTVDDPKPSPFKGYYRVLVHLSSGPQKLDRLYYVSADGQQFIAGNIWDINRSPFVDTVQHLPTNGPSFGPADAKVTIVVFSDFECPYCRELAKTLRDNIPQKYPNDVRVIFKDFPIDAIHKWARAAAEASHCIEHEKPAAFWAFHDWIFEHQQEVDSANLSDKVAAFAKQQNLDATKISACMADHATAPEVNASQRAGQELQISRTPTLFINGRMVPGAVPWEQLDTVIKMELNRPKEIASSHADPCCEITIPTVGKGR
jgi:protein-disulfide isomerase